MKSGEKELALFVRHQGALTPHNEAAMHPMRSIANGVEVCVEIKNRRNKERLKAYWGTLRDCVDATGCTPNADMLHHDVKVGLGYVDHITATDDHGVVTIRTFPASISFSSMTEDEFIKFFNATQRYLAETYGFGG